MTEYTPGPWEYSGAYIYASGENAANICAISAPRASTFVEYTRLAVGSKDIDEAYANARLIAAAPDLLEALQELWVCAETFDAFHDPSHDWFPLKYQIEAALAKATGRSHD